MTIEEAVAKLHDLQTNDDNEAVHVHADNILFQFVPPEIQEAFLALQDEVQFWYA